MKKLLLLYAFAGASCVPMAAQNNPFPSDSPEYDMYQLYLRCEGNNCADQFPEAAKLYDADQTRSMAIELFYFYFASVSYYKIDRKREAGEFGEECDKLLTRHKTWMKQGRKQKDAQYFQGMDKVDLRELESWVKFVTGPQPIMFTYSTTYPGVPSFPFPPPQSSTRKVLDHELFSECKTLGDVAQRLCRALDRCEYEKSFYSIPNGFALVARLEQFDAETALALDPPDRWSVTPPPLRDFGDFLEALFLGNTGHYRMVAFLVTDQPFYESDQRIGVQDAPGWIKGGLNVLPGGVGKKEWTADYQCTALIYEFECTSAQRKGDLVFSTFTAQTHLEKSNILPVLRSFYRKP